MKKKLVALVPVRKGSVRVKHKNIKPFGNTSLLELKINNLKKVTTIDEIIVNSDCDEMLGIAEKMGVSTYKRDEYYARSIINNSDFFVHITQNTNSENIMYSPVTCPFIKVETYHDAIKKFNNFTNHDTLTAVFPINHHMWRDGAPINYDPKNTPSSQDLPEIFGMSYGISIAPKELIISQKNLIGKKPYFYKLDEYEAVDIDTEVEFEFAEFLYKKNSAS